MNKKLIYIFAVLIAGLFVVSACEQAVGIKPARRLERGEEDERFVPINITHYLKVTTNPRDSGNVRLFSSDGRQVYYFHLFYPIPLPSNTRVVLKAISERYWTFENWSGDATGNNENITIIMDWNKSITANFRRT